MKASDYLNQITGDQFYRVYRDLYIYNGCDSEKLADILWDDQKTLDRECNHLQTAKKLGVTNKQDLLKELKLKLLNLNF